MSKTLSIITSIIAFLVLSCALCLPLITTATANDNTDYSTSSVPEGQPAILMTGNSDESHLAEISESATGADISVTDDGKVHIIASNSTADTGVWTIDGDISYDISEFPVAVCVTKNFCTCDLNGECMAFESASSYIMSGEYLIPNPYTSIRPINMCYEPYVIGDDSYLYFYVDVAQKKEGRQGRIHSARFDFSDIYPRTPGSNEFDIEMIAFFRNVDEMQAYMENYFVSLGYVDVDTELTDGTLIYKYDETTEGYAVIGTKEYFSTSSVIVPSSFNGKNVTKIENEAFKDNRIIKSVTLPDTLLIIGLGAFNGCTDLTTISIPESVQGIGGRAFANCSSLKEITLPSGIHTIGRRLFDNSGLTSINIPQGVTVIEECAFSDCRNLVSVNIPDSVNTIERYAFSNCSSISLLVIPQSVRLIGSQAFSHLSSLSALTLPNAGLKIEDWLGFGSTNSLKSITITGGTYVTRDAFMDCNSVYSITLADSITEIRDNAFNNCYSLQNIILSPYTKSIGNGAFHGCKKLSTVYYNGFEHDWNNIAVGESNEPLFATQIIGMQIDPNASAYSQGLEFVINPAGTGYIVTGLGNCSDSIINIPEKFFGIPVVAIDSQAFANIDSVEEIIIPDTVNKIDAYAFSNCTGLKKITIPGGIQMINDGAFNNCSSLKTVIIEIGVSYIGHNVFAGCDALTTVGYEGTAALWQTINVGLNNEKLSSNSIIFDYYDQDTETCTSENTTETETETETLAVTHTEKEDELSETDTIFNNDFSNENDADTGSSGCKSVVNGSILSVIVLNCIAFTILKKKKRD